VKSVPQDVVVVNMMLIIVLVVQVSELQPQPVLVQFNFMKKLIILVNHVIMNVLLVKEIG
jgi:type IV secretory pathway VirB3-like protein